MKEVHLTSQQSNFEYASIDAHPERTDTQIITFKERYVAELFLDRATEISDVNKGDLSWVPNATTTIESTPGPVASEQPASDVDIKMEPPSSDDRALNGGQVNGAEETNVNVNGGADFDVAEDEDQWL